MDDLRKLGEAGIIALFDDGPPAAPVLRGIGDDCAVLGAGEDDVWLWTTDLLSEGVHFRRTTIDAHDLGHKSLAVNLSDIAAMGGRPTAALLTLGLPADLERSWIDDFRSGFCALAKQFRCQIVGGDTCASENAITISVSLLGTMPRGDVLYRSGAHPGDDVWISGVPGMAAFGLALLEAGHSGEDAATGAAIAAHRKPMPHLDLGTQLSGRRLATACIDTSDGIAADLNRLAAASGVSALISAGDLPLPAISPRFPADPLTLALQGGEDYHLLFTAPPEHRDEIQDLPDVHRIGHILAGNSPVRVQRSDGSIFDLVPAGFKHF